MGTFDPAAFLDTQTTEASSTEFVVVDEGDYQAVSLEPEVRPWTGKKDPTKSGYALSLQWEIDLSQYPEQQAKIGRDRYKVKQDIMLDLNDSGGIDTGKGKNIKLGRLREALGLNKPGQPFSFRMLSGRVAKVSVKHRLVDDTIYAEVGGVAPA